MHGIQKADVCFCSIDFDRGLIVYFQGQYQLLAIKEADNQFETNIHLK